MLDILHAEKLQKMTARRKEILEQLTSNEQYRDSPVLAFGPHDPFDVTPATCDTCYSTAKIQSAISGKNKPRWTVTCTSCGKHVAQPQKDRWMAALAWNGINLTTQSYRSLPLFDLAHLTPARAKEKIAKIREVLVLRISLCAVERAIAEMSDSKSKPGRMFQQRLDAYLKWAMHAHRLIKSARAGEGVDEA
ncbi:hypothetical protein [Pseudomonas sp. NPDC089569]|uniref:hypothetical protein n=1 Tax=Pseudomonas sp. NPDC089569 TaxID=3390722 RepID=UPI003CFC6EBA